MIAVFGRKDDTELQVLVEKACALVGIPGHLVQFFELSKEGMETRDYVQYILESDASIIDVDTLDLISYAVEFGAISSGLRYLNLGGVTFREDVDSPIMLFTRQSASYHGEEALNPVVRYFGKYYSVISGHGGLGSDLARGLGDWMLSVLDAGKPKVFISYRSTCEPFARKVATSLRRRGAHVWFDKWTVLPGDRIAETIDRGLSWASHLAILVDRSFMDSRWTKLELDSFLYRYLAGPNQLPQYVKPVERPIIPVLIESLAHQELPPSIRSLRAIDCEKQSFRRSMDYLWASLRR